MTKYRIIQRPSYSFPDEVWYYAQEKILGLFWMNLQSNWEVNLYAASKNLKEVEEYMEYLLQKKQYGIEIDNPQVKVIQEYES